MPTKTLIERVSEPVFYARVAFVALKVAQTVAAEATNTANHENRVKNANRIFRGEENSLLLASHIVSANGTVTNTILSDGTDAVPDGDIEFVLASIWDARANAFVSPNG